MTFLVAGIEHVLRRVARVADSFLETFNPLTYERGDALQAFEEEHEVHEPRCTQVRCVRTEHDDSAHMNKDFYFFTSPEAVVPTAASATPAPVDGTPPASPGAGLSLPMFEFADLQAIASDYLVNHFPWPDGDGKFGCTCGTQGFTIATWSEHVSELQVSETVYYLTGLLYDQQEQP